MYSKKGLHPVIGTTLLVLVAIVSVIGFSTWYSGYFSDIMVDVEQRSSPDESRVDIIFLDGSTLYVQSSQNLTLETIRVDGDECLLNQELTAGNNGIDITSCLENLSNPVFEIFIFGDEGSSSSKYFYEDLDQLDLSSSLNCSNLDGGEWVEVPGNSYFGTDDFCVMKWEAKAFNSSSQEFIEYGEPNWADLSEITAMSSETGRPWANISFENASQACSNLGDDYSLISNVEWMTIARNIEENPQNWNSSEVGVGSLYIGNYNGATSLNGSDSLSDINYRVHALSNSEEIWDMAGNLWNFVDVTGNGTPIGTGAVCESSTTGFAWFSFTGNGTEDECIWQNDYGKTNADILEREIGPSGEYSDFEGVGRIRGYNDNDVYAVRGGFHNDGTEGSGIYSFAASIYPGEAADHIGFRCSYSN